MALDGVTSDRTEAHGWPCASLGKHTRVGGGPRMCVVGRSAGPTRGFGVMHFGVQAVVGAMRFAWMDGLLAALRLTSCICDVCLSLARVQ